MNDPILVNCEYETTVRGRSTIVLNVKNNLFPDIALLNERMSSFIDTPLVFSSCDYECYTDDNNRIGHVRISASRKTANVVSMNRVHVKEEYRRNGVGSNLIKRVIKDFGEKIIYLYVDKTNKPAINLYHKFGFILDVVQEFERGFTMVRKHES